MFCVECGDEPDRLYDGLCAECYKKSKLKVEIDSKIEIDICAVCGSVRKKNRWIENPDIEAIMLNKIDDAISVSYEVDKYSFNVEFEEEDPSNINADIEVELRAEDLSTEKMISTKIIFKKTQCKICSRVHGDYYEAILQVRPTDKEMTDEQKDLVIDKVKKRIEVKEGEKRSIFLTSYEEKHGGLDFYLSDTSATKKLAHDISNSVGGSVKSSAKLAGREDGQNIYRMTYSVRIPPYEPGDFIEVEEKTYRVKKLQGGGGKIVLRDIRTGKKVKMDDKQIESAVVLGGSELIKKSVVVSEDQKEMKLLDPESYETVTVLKPEGFETEGEEVSAINVKGRLYVLEEEG
ncbi:MAG: NMD3-related protein [Candidatus Saliniplasma sp.]